MRIDLPRCNFKNCQYCFDSNCTKKIEHERCEYRQQKAEIEALKLINSTCEVEVSRIRNVSIKLFVWNLKKRLKKRTEYDEGGWGVDLFTVTEEDIDNLVKELTEGNDA